MNNFISQYLTQHLLSLWDWFVIPLKLSHWPGPFTPIFDNTSFCPGLQTNKVAFLSPQTQLRNFYPDSTISWYQLHFSSPSAPSLWWFPQLQLTASSTNLRWNPMGCTPSPLWKIFSPVMHLKTILYPNYVETWGRELRRRTLVPIQVGKYLGTLFSKDYWRKCFHFTHKLSMSSYF